MKFSPTNRVRVTQTLYDPITFAVTVTGGTIGQVISFEEYCAYRHWDKDGSGFPERAKEDFNSGSMCPIKISWYAPLEPGGDEMKHYPIVAILSSYLELLETDPQESQTKLT